MAATVSASLSRQIRAALEGASAITLPGLLVEVDEFVVMCSSSPERETLAFQFGEDLQTVHDQVVDHSSLSQTEIFLAVLYHLLPVFSSTSIISTWFDLIIRPALREPRLSTAATNHAKELICSALGSADVNKAAKVREFRCRLLDLYLLDAYNEGSRDDVLEWARLDQRHREQRKHWKDNLEDVLLKSGTGRPQDLMTEMHNYFSTPSARLQLLVFFDLFVSKPSFSSSASTLAKHPLMSSLLNSLLLDNSPTGCTIGLTLLVKLLPIFAVEACEQLKLILPTLFAILARIMCWKEKPPSRYPPSPEGEAMDRAEFEQGMDFEVQPILDLRPGVHWQRLERTFKTTTSCSPSPRSFFTILYYLFPCNLFKFLRRSVPFLNQNDTECPYAVGWAKVVDELEVWRKGEELLRSHTCHTLSIGLDAATESSEPPFWERYDVAQIATEARMLDAINAALAMRERAPELVRSGSPLLWQGDGSIPLPDPANYTPSIQKEPFAADPRLDRSLKTPSSSLASSQESTASPTTITTRLSSESPRISIQGMITTSVALKSDIEVEIVNYPTSWPSTLFPKTLPPANKGSKSPQSESAPPSSLGTDGVPLHVSQAVGFLQHELLLLRSELNFELWLSRENIKHIGRLYQHRVLAKNTESERQGLYNKLRNYRTQVSGLERELREHKDQASSAKTKYADWNIELTQRLRVLRDEKKAWITEAATLRASEKETQAKFEAQGELLADATNKVFELRTEIKAIQPKIDRLRDYEKTIEQHEKMQSLWDADFRKFNDRAEEIELMKAGYKRLELRADAYEKTLAELEDSLREHRRQIHALEGQLTLERKKTESLQKIPAPEITAFVDENSRLQSDNAKLREENTDLREKLDELQAKVQILDGELSGRKGLIYPKS